MQWLELWDRIGQRRHERAMAKPYRPTDNRMLLAGLLFLGYYTLIFVLLKYAIPEKNEPLVRDALLVLGPVIGGIGVAIFRTDLRDELQTQNTGEGFRALRSSAEATKETAKSLPNPPSSTGAAEAADQVAGAAKAEADDIRRDEGSPGFNREEMQP